MIPLQADRVSDKSFYLKAVASVTLDPNGKYFLCQQTLSLPNKFLPVAPTASSHRE
jgi:hypothetical protein